jgi:hypothetical protein
MRVAIGTQEEVVQVREWRVQWLRAGGYTKKNAELIAKSQVDWRYANSLLESCKAKGYSEDFVIKLLL